MRGGAKGLIFVLFTSDYLYFLINFKIYCTEKNKSRCTAYEEEIIISSGETISDRKKNIKCKFRLPQIHTSKHGYRRDTPVIREYAPYVITLKQNEVKCVLLTKGEAGQGYHRPRSRPSAFYRLFHCISSVLGPYLSSRFV